MLSAVDPERVRQVVDEVLSRPEFVGRQPGLIQRIRAWFSDRLEDLLRWIEGLLGAPVTGSPRGWVSYLLLAILVGIVTVLVVRFLRGTKRQPRSKAAADEELPARAAREWFSEADEHERAGRWREAVRCRWRGILAELAGQGVVEEVPGRTTGEYRIAVVAALGERADPFTEATGVFERTWYGHMDAGSPTLVQLRESEDRLRRAVAATGSRAA